MPRAPRSPTAPTRARAPTFCARSSAGCRRTSLPRSRRASRRSLEIVFEEHERDYVFQRLCLGIGLHSFLADQRADAGNRRVVVAHVAQNSACTVGVEVAQRCAPLLIPGARLRTVAARNLPALDVLAAHRELQRLGGVGDEAREHRAHSLRVYELLRTRATGDRLAIRIETVGRVDLRDRRGEAPVARLRHRGARDGATGAGGRLLLELLPPGRIEARHRIAGGNRGLA